MNSEVITKIKEKFAHIHPLIVHRSVERAKSPGDLFDILDELSTNMKETFMYPLIWHEEDHRWRQTSDIFQLNVFFIKHFGKGI